jgi:hypothetical protein
MREDEVIDAEQMKQALNAPPSVAAFERPRRDSGLYFVDQLGREAKALAGVDSLTATSYTVRSTIDQALQRATETALQDGLARYEMNNDRVDFQGPEANLADAVRRLQSDPKALPSGVPVWQLALQGALSSSISGWTNAERSKNPASVWCPVHGWSCAHRTITSKTRRRGHSIAHSDRHLDGPDTPEILPDGTGSENLNTSERMRCAGHRRSKIHRENRCPRTAPCSEAPRSMRTVIDLARTWLKFFRKHPGENHR